MNIKFSAKEEKEDRIEEKGFQFEYCYLMAIKNKCPNIWANLKRIMIQIENEVRK